MLWFGGGVHISSLCDVPRSRTQKGSQHGRGTSRRPAGFVQTLFCLFAVFLGFCNESGSAMTTQGIFTSVSSLRPTCRREHETTWSTRNNLQFQRKFLTFASLSERSGGYEDVEPFFGSRGIEDGPGDGGQGGAFRGQGGMIQGQETTATPAVGTSSTSRQRAGEVPLIEFKNVHKVWVCSFVLRVLFLSLSHAFIHSLTPLSTMIVNLSRSEPSTY